MRNDTGHTELMERLAQLSKCTYVSDLILPERKPQVLVALQEIAADGYTLQDWKQVADYLGYKPQNSEDSKQIREHLIQRLKA